MTNYENDIMDMLQGDTPKQKYDYLIEILKMFREKNSGVEIELLNVCNRLEKVSIEMFKASGNDSYVERTHNYDAKLLIYGLTNKCRIEKIDFIKWREAVQSR